MNTNGHEGRAHGFVFIRVHWCLKICLKWTVNTLLANREDDFAAKMAVLQELVRVRRIR